MDSSRILIEDALIVLENESVVGSLLVDNGKIARIEPKNSGFYSFIVAPGIVDLHTHGSGGYDFMDGTAEAIEEAAKSHLRHGTTTLLPTSCTTDDEDLFRFLDNFDRANREGLPHLEGVHLEGQYFAYSERGAQDPRFLKTPKKEHWREILRRGRGNIRRWTLAPELDGAMEMLDDLKGEGILFSAGHTEADYQTIKDSVKRGVRLLTHFYSGMSSIRRVDGFRVLGAVESGYLIDDLSVELISDGKHLPPELLRMIFKLKDKSRIISCTDSMRGAGMKEGVYVLGPKDTGVESIVEDGVAKMMDHTGFAGSVATGETVIKTLRNIVGLELHEVFRIASLQPAKLISIDGKTGSIKEGKEADLIVLDKSLDVQRVFVSGKERYRRNS